MSHRVVTGLSTGACCVLKGVQEESLIIADQADQIVGGFNNEMTVIQGGGSTGDIFNSAAACGDILAKLRDTN